MKINITLFFIFIIISCSKSINELDSDQFKNKEERIETLKKEIKWQSEFIDAEFELFNVNGFTNNRGSIPGASSLDYKFVIQVKTCDINKWTIGMVKTEVNDKKNDWIKEITKKRKEHWKTESLPEFFKREKENAEMIVFRTEGIIYKRIIVE